MAKKNQSAGKVRPKFARNARLASFGHAQQGRTLGPCRKIGCCQARRVGGVLKKTSFLSGTSYESGVVFSEYSFAWRSTTLFKSIPIALQSFSNASRASIDGTSDLRYCIHSRRLETAEQYDRRGKTLLKSTQECLPLGV